MANVGSVDDYNNGLIYTNITDCIDCNKCIHDCPALKSNVSVRSPDGSYKVYVDEVECILCGKCLDSCVHGVRHYSDDCGQFFAELEEGRNFALLVAPSFYLVYPQEYRRVLGYLKSLGVKNIYPVGYGADIAVWAYINYFLNNGATCMISQPCPCIVSFIEKHKPELLTKLMPVQSPMMCLAIYLKRYMNISDDLAFLSPCVGKKTEINSARGMGLIRHNVTFDSLMAHIEENGVNLNAYPNSEADLVSGMGSLFPHPGGLKANIEYYLGRQAGVFQIEGERKVYDFLKAFAGEIQNSSRFMPMLVDALNCDRGCSYGTGTRTRRDTSYKAAYQAILMRMEKYSSLKDDDQNVLESYGDRLRKLNETFKDLNIEDFFCEYDTSGGVQNRVVTDEEADAIFADKLLKFTHSEKTIDCSACGYKTCRDMADAIAYGINHNKNCVYYVRSSLAKSIIEMKEAEENSMIKSRFLARMSHEIRTPLSAVLGISEIQLQRKELSLEIEEAFAKIYNSANILLGIVNDILDLSKIEAGKMDLINERYETASLISDVVQLNLAYMGSKRLDFTVDADKDIPSYLIGDELRIKQIMNNLLSNAFKYTEEGSVELQVFAAESELDDWINLVIIIRDTGMGMSQEQKAALFEDYTRFHEKEARFISGTGLGMPITFNLLKLMDAPIDVDSKIGVGTTVTIAIPQQIGSNEGIGEEASKNLRHFNTELRSVAKRLSFKPQPMPYGRVLVVDDVETNIFVAKGLMGLYHLQIDSCNSGFEAIEKVKEGNSYDIIFMDQMMPELSGIEATAILRKMNYTRPIVALTANALVGQADEFLRNGFDGFLSKPIQTVHLNGVLHKFIKDVHEKAGSNVVTPTEEPKNNEAEVFDDYLLIPEIAEKIRADFKETQSNVILEIVQAINDGDTRTAHRLVHSLKGLAGLLNETMLASYAETMEKSLKIGAIPEMSALAALEEEVNATLARIENGS